MRIELGRQQFKLLWAADESGTMWEPSWAFAACMNMTGETLEEVAVHNRVDENDPSVLANDALVNALMEAAPADGDRVLVEKKGGLAAGKLVGAYAEGEQISVLFDCNKKASECAAASLVSLAPPAAPPSSPTRPSAPSTPPTTATGSGFTASSSAPPPPPSSSPSSLTTDRCPQWRYTMCSAR